MLKTNSRILPQTVQGTPQWAGLAMAMEADWILLSPLVSGDRCTPDLVELVQRQDRTAPGSNLNCVSPCTACNLQIFYIQIDRVNIKLVILETFFPCNLLA